MNRNLSPALTAIIVLGLAACKPEEPPFIYDDATVEEQQDFVDRQVSYLKKYIPNRVLAHNMELHAVKGMQLAKTVEIRMRCTMGAGWDCKAPRDYHAAKEEKTKQVCRVYRHMAMSKHNFRLKWIDESNGGGAIMAVTVDRNACGMAQS